MKDTQTLAQKSSTVKIPYSCGKAYLSQTSCHISTCLLQAQQSVAPEYTKTKQSIDFDRTEVLANIIHLIKTVKLPHNFNHEDGYKQSNIWFLRSSSNISSSPNKQHHTLHLPTLF
jgi:hypothetical protein